LNPASRDGVLLLDKPAGITSTQALAKAKRILGARKAGHTGTLDPFATGLLPLVFGEGTKFARFLIDATKGYQATLRLGVETTTGDTEGTELVRLPIDVDEHFIDEVLERYIGAGEQVPPMHSAVRIDGRRLYELARKGIEIERAPRAIEILDLRREAFSGEDLVVSVTCSKGTYIRTLARDIGRSLGCGAYLTALRRTAVGGFALGQATTLDDLAADPAPGARLLPVDVLVANVPRWDCSQEGARRFSQGQEIEGPDSPEGTELAVFGAAGRFMGVGRIAPGRRLAPLRLMSLRADGESPDFA
jgi:tRNA pseudouridine55 synthase